MKIVIDMPEEDYRKIKDGIATPNRVDKLLCALLDGTPLPKGHGRLIDADALESEFDMLEKVTNEGSLAERAEHKKLLECIRIAKTAPTIIEADEDGQDGR